MKTRPTKFGVRENTASARQHAPRGVMNASLLPSDALFGTEQQDKRTRELTSPIKESFELSFTETDKGATGGRDSGTITGALLGDGKLSVVERPLTCQEAAAFVRVTRGLSSAWRARARCLGISVLDVGTFTLLNWTVGCEWNYTQRASSVRPSIFPPRRSLLSAERPALGIDLQKPTNPNRGSR